MALTAELVQDLRYSARFLVRSRAFTITAVLTLALGIGANTALFSIVNGILLNPLPYPNADRLTAIYERAPGFDKAPMSYPNFQDWQRMSQRFSSMAIYRNQDYNFTGANEAERLAGLMISADFFTTLGVTPVIGRTFAAEDDRPGANPVAVLSGGYWQRRFGSSPSVLGTTITLNGKPYSVIGVIPATFAFYGAQRDVYTAIGQWTDPSFRDRSIEVSTHAVGLLKSGVTLSQATADMDAVARDLDAAYPDADKGLGIAIVPLKDDITGNIRPVLLLMLAAVGFLLLIACANVANLVLARSTARSREFAIRAALGAGHGRLVRQLLIESVLLACAGGALGLFLTFAGTSAALRALPSAIPRAADVGIDTRVLLFTLGASVLAGIAFGIVPALRMARVNLHNTLKDSARGSSGSKGRLQRVFVVAEVALALVLLAGSGLMLRSVSALLQVNPGFEPRHAATFSLSLPAGENTNSAETRARLRRLDAALSVIPGVDAVSVTLGSRPMVHDTSLPFWIEGQPKPAVVHEMAQAMTYLVEAGFQRAMGMTLLRGRFVTADDTEHAPVVVDIDDVFARTYFPGENPIGKRINITGFDVQAEVVGVVGHIKQWRLDADPASAVETQIYYPFMQLPEKLMPLAADAVAVVLRSKGDPVAIMAPVRRAVAVVEPRAVIYAERTMEDIVASSFAGRRLAMILLTMFAALALALACVGIYGVVSYLVGERTREIGIRIALGAPRGEILRMIIGQGTRMTLVGLAIGAAAALGLTRVIAAQLFGVTSRDPITFSVVAVLLMAVAIAASYIPARRAMSVDPMVAMRNE